MQLEVKDKMTLGELLHAFEMVDNGLASITPEQLEAMSSKAAMKVDDYKYFMEKCEGEVDRLKKRIEEFQKTKKTIENTQRRLKEIMVFHMKENNFDKLVGNDFKVNLQSTTKATWKTPEPSEAQRISLSNYVRVKYEWDKKAIENELKNGDKEKFKGIAELGKTYYPKFYVQKRIGD